MGYTIWPDGPTGDVLSEVNQERYRQEDLVRQGKFLYSCASPQLTTPEKMAVLSEEVGEVAREVCELIIDYQKKAGKSKALQAKIRKELIQVAAVAVAWAESLEEK